MKLPRLLDGTRISCISLSVNQSIIPLSNATLEVLKEDALPIRTYVEITTPNGITEIYRTRQPQTTHGSDIATIQLDHAICEVGDYLIQDAISEETTVAQAFSSVFSHYRGTAWQLGTITASETVTLDCDYDNILETLLAILEQVPQYYMTFDFTTTPWTLGIAQKSDTITAEGRLSRNIESAVVKYDDKDQCTRVYVKGLPKPTGREEDENAIGYMDAPAATIAQYGIIEKETGSGNLTQEQATRIATAYLNAHKDPRFSVEINGYDLSEITGESLDSYVCGKKFQLSIPDDGIVVSDHITKVSFQDAIKSDACNVIIGDEQDAAINFLQEQASNTKSSRSSGKKQQKLDESFEKNFVKTDEYGAILEQAGMKLDSHGMIVYARDNVNNIGSILDLTASEIRAEVTAGDLELQSEISQTASAIRLSVDNSLSDVHSSITATADQIRSEVHAANSTVYSFINQTATYIQSVVADVNDDLHSEILQTKSMIRNAVWTANSTVWTEIRQTEQYILDHVGERSGSKVIPSMTAPQDSPENPLSNGDVWVEGSLINTWDDFPEGTPWVDYDPTAYQYDWLELSGQQVHVWRDGKWNLVEDGTKLVEDTWFMRTKDTISQIAGNVEKIDGEFRKNLANLSVKADRISATVTQHGKSIGEIGSNITQTATQIRAEVHAANSTLYSYIDMTATYIRSEVGNTVSQLQSSIMQQADKIALVVESTASGNKIKPASIVAAINNGGSSVVISANHINLDGYVKATDLTSTYLSAQIANFALLSSERGGISVYSVGTTSYTQGGVSCYVPHAITSLRLTSSGNTYTLQKKWFSEDDWSTVGTFSRAVSNWTWGGGNGKVWVKAQPQDQTLNVNLAVDGSAEITSNGTYTYKAYYGDDNDIYWDTGAHKTVTVSVSGDTPSKVEIWYADDSGVVPTRNISSAISIKPWCKIGNTWYPGSAITLTPDYAFSCNKRASLDDTYDANTLSFGSISKSYVSSASYIYFTVECGGHTKKCRIELT